MGGKGPSGAASLADRKEKVRAPMNAVLSFPKVLCLAGSRSRGGGLGRIAIRQDIGPKRASPVAYGTQ